MKTRANMIFRRFGRVYHLYLHDADDLAGVLELDKAHWVYTNAPNSTLRGDEMFLLWSTSTKMAAFDHTK